MDSCLDSDGQMVLQAQMAMSWSTSSEGWTETWHDERLMMKKVEDGWCTMLGLVILHLLFCTVYTKCVFVNGKS